MIGALISGFTSLLLLLVAYASYVNGHSSKACFCLVLSILGWFLVYVNLRYNR